MTNPISGRIYDVTDIIGELIDNEGNVVHVYVDEGDIVGMLEVDGDNYTRVGMMARELFDHNIKLGTIKPTMPNEHVLMEFTVADAQELADKMGVHLTNDELSTLEDRLTCNNFAYEQFREGAADIIGELTAQRQPE